MNDRCRDGWFFTPTVITGLPMGCRTNQEEILGPVVTVTPFDGEDDAVALADRTDYGLSATIWTRDVGRAHRVADRIQAGTVWVNCSKLKVTSDFEHPHLVILYPKLKVTSDFGFATLRGFSHSLYALRE